MKVAKFIVAGIHMLFALIFALAFLTLAGLQAQEKKPPEKLVFETKMGNVTFDHAKHLERAGGDCTTCHEKVFQQSKEAPLHYKEKMHQAAEASKTSCATCHVAGGKAFATKGNCKNCHVK